MLKTAAKEFDINYSSAKSIFHTYRKEGRVTKKSLRDRYLKKSEITTIPKPTFNSNSMDLMQKYQAFLANANKISNGNGQQEARVVDLKATQQQSFKVKPKLPYFEDSLPKLVQANYQNQYGTNSPTFYNFNPVPQMINQINNINMYQELARVHGIISNNLPLALGKPVVFNNTLLDNFSALSSLQSQQKSPSARLLHNAKLF